METTDERIDRIENRNKVNFFEVEKRLTDLESRKSDTDPGEVHSRIHELEDLILLLQVEITKIKDNLAGGAEVELPHPSDIQKQIESLDERISQMTTSTTADTVELENINVRLSNIENEIESVKGSPTAEPSLLPEGIDKKLEDLEHAVDSLKTENIDLPRPVLETGEDTRYENLEYRIKELESRAQQQISEDTEKRIEYIEKEAGDITNLKRMLDEEIAKRASLEKRITDLRHAPPVPSANVENLRHEIENQKVILDDIHKNMEIRSVKFLTKKLEDFAKVIDQKMETMETPKIESRLREAEKKLDKITEVLHRFSTTMPIVVE